MATLNFFVEQLERRRQIGLFLGERAHCISDPLALALSGAFLDFEPDPFDVETMALRGEQSFLGFSLFDLLLEPGAFLFFLG